MDLAPEQREEQTPNIEELFKGRNQYTGSEDEEARENRRKRHNYLACDILLARLYKNHPDHAIAALKGIQPNVVDLEPPPAPVIYTDSVVVPVPVPGGFTLAQRRPTMAMIVGEVCKFYGIELIDIHSDRRTNTIVGPRQVAMYLARAMTINSLPVIGRLLGNRDHTTVLHGANKIEKLVKSGGRIADEVDVIKLHIAQELINQA